MRIKPYVPGKPIEEVQRELGLKDVIKLASNENPLGPSPGGLKAVEERIGSIHIYPDGSCFQLKDALSRHLQVDREQIMVGNGSDELLKMIGEAFLNPGDEVIMAQPSFSEYNYVARLMGAVEVVVPTKDYTHDLEAMADAITEKTKIIFVCNPNNPTGTIVKRREVEDFLQRVPDNVLVVFDEAYYEYVDDPDYPQTLEYIAAGRNVITLRTFSKIYGLAGLRVGYGVATKEVAQLVDRVREPFNVNSLGQIAGVGALADTDFLQRSRQVNREGRDYLYQAFADLGLRYVPTQANFILVDVGQDSSDVFKKLLAQGVIVRSGDIFGLQTYLRVTIGKAEENERFINALKKVLGK
ncbi:MAG: histidinol-phosphate transaminase [Limnochordia bacterium]